MLRLLRSAKTQGSIPSADEPSRSAGHLFAEVSKANSSDSGVPCLPVQMVCRDTVLANLVNSSSREPKNLMRSRSSRTHAPASSRCKRVVCWSSWTSYSAPPALIGGGLHGLGRHVGLVGSAGGSRVCKQSDRCSLIPRLPSSRRLAGIQLQLLHCTCLAAVSERLSKNDPGARFADPPPSRVCVTAHAFRT